MQHKSVILRTGIIFVVSYVLFLLFWIQVKGYYGRVMTTVVSQGITVIKHVQYEGIVVKGDVMHAEFLPLRHKSPVVIEIPVKTSSYTFNAPLTFAILASLSSFVTRRGRAYAEALVILVMVHLLYVFSLELKEITEVFVNMGYEPVSRPRMYFQQFLWTFTDNMVIRFEPFLIGFYVYIRHRKKNA